MELRDTRLEVLELAGFASGHRVAILEGYGKWISEPLGYDLSKQLLLLLAKRIGHDQPRSNGIERLLNKLELPNLGSDAWKFGGVEDGPTFLPSGKVSILRTRPRILSSTGKPRPQGQG